MRKMIPFFQLTILSLAASVLSHGFYLLQWQKDRFMAGYGDGVAQILPFKKHLYDQYTSGELFYSPSFGLGAGTYGELSYYFSTSVVFLLTVLVFYLLETIGIISHPDVLFWAEAAVFISIFRLTAVLIIAHSVFRYMGIARIPAFLAALIYGVSAMYFRFAVFWEFFADVYLWLPVLILGVEKIFRENKSGWFIFAVAITMFDNFYFAYINLLLIGLYFSFRLFMPLTDNETSWKQALLKFGISGLFGAGISAVSFIPAVYAFLGNYRPPYMEEIAWFDFSDNILFTSRFIILPSIVVLMLFAFPLYRDRRFRFFAILLLIGIALHYSPMVGSLFNGFSRPRNRWEYFLVFVSGGMTAYGLHLVERLKKSHLLFAGLAAAFIYAFFIVTDEKLDDELPAILVITAISMAMFLLLALASRNNSKQNQLVFAGGIGLLLIVFNNGYQLQLWESERLDRVSESFITGPEYDDPEIRTLLIEIDQHASDSFNRIDWMEGLRNNTPLVQDYRGVSAYSSILNGELLEFYLYELKIDMGRESISRYAGLGRRANLHSLLQADYLILGKNDESVPYGFQQMTVSENYFVYENQLPLPFVRGVSNVYTEEQLQTGSVLRREHAMLTGVVLKESENPASLPPEPEAHTFTIEEHDAIYEEDVLEVTGETGGINLQMDDPVPGDSDLYVSFHLTNYNSDGTIPLTVNEYRTTRKANDSLFRTYVDDLTIRVAGNETVSLRLPEGTYQLKELKVQEEPYEILETEAEITKDPAAQPVEWDGSRMDTVYQNEQNASHLVIPIPYEQGWRAEVNGDQAEVLEANYAFMAVPAQQGRNDLTLRYRPPYFLSSLGISVFSIILAVLFIYRKKARK